jgi:HAD superfamily hydrolase (TIGR01458 family)
VRGIRAVLLDIDGTLVVSWRPLPGAVDAVRWLRAGGYRLALLTNTTSRTRSWIARTLGQAGFPVAPADIFTAPAITASYLAEHYPGARCALLSSGDVRPDLPGVTLLADGDTAQPDVLILGGAGPEFSYPALNRAFSQLRGGARLVAMHRNLSWRTDAGLQLDSGAYLAGLELAAGVRAEVTGKPAVAFFASALAALGTAPAEAIMVGDDLENDVLAAQRSGVSGVLVQTGKSPAGAPGGAVPPSSTAASARTESSPPPSPDHVLPSVADLPSLLGGPAAG